MNTPLVSIIIPNYNHARYLKQRLDTVFQQSLCDYEVIILDDCSTDNSREILSAYQEHPQVTQVVFNESNTGSPFKQWAKGISLAKGKYSWIAETDDFSHPDFLKTLVAVLEADAKLVLAFSGSHWVDDKGAIGNDLSIYTTSFTRNGNEEIIQALSKYNTIQNVSSVVFRSDALKQVSQAYTGYRACGDWILYTELLALGNMAFVADKLNFFRWYHANTSNNSSKQGIWEYEGIDVLALVKQTISLTAADKAAISSFWKKRLKPLRKTIPISWKRYLTIHQKLYHFSPFHYLRYLFV